MAMRINGSVHVMQDQQLRCSATYAPLGETSADRPSRVFANRRELETFLAGSLGVDHREIRSLREALARHGRYTILEVWMPDAEIVGLGLCPVRSASSAPGAIVYPAAA
jgi:hypothetical protein